VRSVSEMVIARLQVTVACAGISLPRVATSAVEGMFEVLFQVTGRGSSTVKTFVVEGDSERRPRSRACGRVWRVPGSGGGDNGR